MDTFPIIYRAQLSNIPLMYNLELWNNFLIKKVFRTILKNHKHLWHRLVSYFWSKMYLKDFLILFSILIIFNRYALRLVEPKPIYSQAFAEPQKSGLKWPKRAVRQMVQTNRISGSQVPLFTLVCSLAIPVFISLGTF